MNELDFYNPDMELVEVNPKRRKRRRNPESIAIATPVLLLIAGYLAWCGYSQYKTGSWTFTPWKTTPIARRLPLGKIRQQRDWASFDRHIEQAMSPAPSVEEVDVWKFKKPTDEEQVGFINP